MSKEKRGGALAVIYGALPYALFLTGGGLVAILECGSYSFFIAALLGALALFAAFWGAKSIFKAKRKGGASKLICGVATVFGVLLCGVVLFHSAREVGRFAANVMGIRAPYKVLCISFLGFCAILASKGVRVIKKYSLVAFAVVLICTLLIFGFSIPSAELSNLSEISLGKFSAADTGMIFAEVFAPLLIALIYFSAERKKRRLKHRTSLCAPLGLLIGVALLSVCFFNVVLLLGNYAAAERYPYFSAAGAVSAGRLFLRIEGAAYFIYLAAVTVRGGVSVATAAALLTGFREESRRYRALCFLVSGAVLGAMLLLG